MTEAKFGNPEAYEQTLESIYVGLGIPKELLPDPNVSYKVLPKKNTFTILLNAEQIEDIKEWGDYGVTSESTKKEKECQNQVNKR